MNELFLNPDFVEKNSPHAMPVYGNQWLEPLICERSCVNCRNAARTVIEATEKKLGETNG